MWKLLSYCKNLKFLQQYIWPSISYQKFYLFSQFSVFWDFNMLPNIFPFLILGKKKEEVFTGLIQQIVTYLTEPIVRYQLGIYRWWYRKTEKKFEIIARVTKQPLTLCHPGFWILEITRGESSGPIAIFWLFGAFLCPLVIMLNHI